MKIAYFDKPLPRLYIVQLLDAYKGRLIILDTILILSNNIADFVLGKLKAKEKIVPILVKDITNNDLETIGMDVDYLIPEILASSKSAESIRQHILAMRELPLETKLHATNIRFGVNATLSDTLMQYVRFQSGQDQCITDFDDVASNTFNPPEPVRNKAMELHIKDKNHYTEIANFQQKLPTLYESPSIGEVYYVDFGQGYGNELPFLRPAVVLRDGISDNTVIVVPATSNKANWNCIPGIHPVINITDNGIFAEKPKANLTYPFLTLLYDHQRTVDKSRLRKYLFKIKPKYLSSITEVALGKLYKLNVPPPQEKIHVDLTPEFFLKQRITEKAYQALIDQTKSPKARILAFLKNTFGFKYKSNEIKILVDAIYYCRHIANYSFNIFDFIKYYSIYYPSYESYSLEPTLRKMVAETITSPQIRPSDFIVLIAKVYGKKEF